MARKTQRVSERPSVVTLLIDTNVVLDVILARSPWDQEATLLLNALAAGDARGFMAPHSVTTVHYVVERERSRQVATAAVVDLLQLLPVVPLESGDFHRAATLGLRDFEDAVPAAACLRIGADFLVTRNPRDYRSAPVQTRSAGEIIAMLRTSASEP